MKKETNIYIVPSPFPYICACEARARFGKDKNNILILLFDSSKNLKNDNKVMSLVDESLWDEVHHVLPQSSSFKKHNSEIALVWRIKKKYGQATQVFATEMNIFLVHLAASSMKAEELVLLDEGCGTIDVVEWIRSGERTYKPRKKSIGTRALVKLAGLSCDTVPQFSLFSIYDLEPVLGVIPKVYRHNLEELRKQVGADAPVREGVYILGSPARTLEYKYQLAKLEERFKGRTIIYLPHRTTYDEMWDHLRNKTSFIIDDAHDGPVELKFIMEGIKPEAHVGFYSTATSTLSVLYPDSEAYNAFMKGETELFITEAMDEYYQKHYTSLAYKNVKEVGWNES